MRKPLYIFGAGGLGKEIFQYVLTTPDVHTHYDFAGFLDDHPLTSIHRGFPVLNPLELSLNHTYALLLSVGSPSLKNMLERRFSAFRPEYPVLVHPLAQAIDRQGIEIGKGTVICPGTVLTTDILIGCHVLINLNCTIGHDAVIGDFSSLMPGVHISGQVVVGTEVMMGTGAVVLNGVHIGDRAKIGAGAVVTRDVAPGTTVVGIPARPVNQ